MPLYHLDIRSKKNQKIFSTNFYKTQGARGIKCVVKIVENHNPLLFTETKTGLLLRVYTTDGKIPDSPVAKFGFLKSRFYIFSLISRGTNIGMMIILF